MRIEETISRYLGEMEADDPGREYNEPDIEAGPVYDKRKKAEKIKHHQERIKDAEEQIKYHREQIKKLQAKK